MMKLKIGKEETSLTENKTVKLNDVNELLFIHSIKNVATHMLSLAVPTEEEQEVIDMYEELCNADGTDENPFSEEVAEEIIDKFFDLKFNGISNKYLQDIGGISLEIESGSYEFMYEFDGVDFKEVIKKDGKVLVDNAHPKLFIAGLDTPLVDVNVNESDVDEPLAALWASENSESTFCSAAVLCSEYKDLGSVDKAWKKILKPAYVALGNELQKIITELFNENGESKLLMDVPEDAVHDLEVLQAESKISDSVIVYTGQ